MKINEEVIFNRLPQNYFMEDNEQKDLNVVLSNIKEMREGFVEYMALSNF